MIHETRARPTAYYSPFTRSKKKKSHLVSLNCKDSLNFVFTGGFLGFLVQEDSFSVMSRKRAVSLINGDYFLEEVISLLLVL